MVNWDSLLLHDNVKSRLLYGKIFNDHIWSQLHRDGAGQQF